MARPLRLEFSEAGGGCRTKASSCFQNKTLRRPVYLDRKVSSKKNDAASKPSFSPGYVWHITHRCHQKQFLLKFPRDRGRYLHWLFEAKKRFGLSVLNYMVTSNPVHLLVKDTGSNVIAQSMQLIAGRTAQEYNQRKNRNGAFWEDRYHAIAIEADEHLHRSVS